MKTLPINLIEADKWYKRCKLITIKKQSFQIVLETGVQTIEIPQGFVFDGASVPRVFRFILSPIGKYITDAMIHDYLYKTQPVTRKKADSLLYEGFIQHGIPKPLALTMYLSIRAFGWWYWSKGGKGGP